MADQALALEERPDQRRIFFGALGLLEHAQHPLHAGDRALPRRIRIDQRALVQAVQLFGAEDGSLVADVRQRNDSNAGQTLSLTFADRSPAFSWRAAALQAQGFRVIQYPQVEFKELNSWHVQNCVELEQALHWLLSPFRVHRGREFFTEDTVAFVEGVVAIHGQVQRVRRSPGENVR